MKKNHVKLLIISNFIAFIATLWINFLSNALPLNGNTPAQLSDKYPNLFVPAGLTFSIWGIIYTLLLVFVIWQFGALFNEKHLKKNAIIIEKLSWLFVLTCLLNISWLFAWHWQLLIISGAVMTCLLVSLIYLNNKVAVGAFKENMAEKWLIHAPFGLYLGWISVATIANITAILIGFEWNAWGISAGNWTIIMVCVGFSIACGMVLFNKNVFYGLAVIWAFYGIWLKRSIDTNEISQQIAHTALVAFIVLIILVVWKFRAWLKS